MNGTTFASPNLPQSESDWRVVQRVGILVALLTVELSVLREWLNNAGSLHSEAMATLLAQRGPGTLRFVVVRFLVAFAMVTLVFVDARAIAGPRRVLSALVRRRFDWPLLLGHLALAGVFAALSSFLYDLRLPAPLDFTVTTVWLLTGLAAGGTAVLAFVPAGFWAEVFRSLLLVVAFAFLVSIAAYVFGQLALTLWRPLSRGTLLMAFAILSPLVPGLTADPPNLILGSPTFEVFIDSACSGYDGLGLMLVFTTAWLWFHRAEWRFPQALILIPAGLGAIWTVNCVRVAALVLIGSSGAPEIAIGGFHTQAGWLGFAAVAMGICLTARRLPWLLKHENQTTLSEEISNPAAAYLLPFLAILASSMIAQLASTDFEWLYPMRVVASLAVLWYFRESYRTFNWRFGWPSIALGVFVFIVWMGLEPFVNPGAQAGVPLALSEAPAGARFSWLVFRILGAVVVVPIAEELAFRGFLLRQFDSRDFEMVRWQSVSWAAVLLSSLAFGVLHGIRWLPALIAGTVYAFAVRRRGSMGDAVAAHATTNALIAAAVLWGGLWRFW